MRFYPYFNPNLIWEYKSTGSFGLNPPTGSHPQQNLTARPPISRLPPRRLHRSRLRSSISPFSHCFPPTNTIEARSPLSLSPFALPLGACLLGSGPVRVPSRVQSIVRALIPAISWLAVISWGESSAMLSTSWSSRALPISMRFLILMIYLCVFVEWFG